MKTHWSPCNQIHLDSVLWGITDSWSHATDPNHRFLINSKGFTWLNFSGTVFYWWESFKLYIMTIAWAWHALLCTQPRWIYLVTCISTVLFTVRLIWWSCYNDDNKICFDISFSSFMLYAARSWMMPHKEILRPGNLYVIFLQVYYQILSFDFIFIHTAILLADKFTTIECSSWAYYIPVCKKKN